MMLQPFIGPSRFANEIIFLLIKSLLLRFQRQKHEELEEVLLSRPLGHTFPFLSNGAVEGNAIT
jgi:hypothetical protein